MALDPMSNLQPALSGGQSQVIDPGEDFIWRQYLDPLTNQDWYNIWFYNDPLDLNKVKKIRMGFWIQPWQVGPPSEIYYVVNWSSESWNFLGGYPLPADESFVRRSPINGPYMIGGLQWFELYFVVPDFNPEWVSIDIWGENILIEQMPMSPPPGSPLLTYWLPSMPGGIVVHECLPENTVSTWSGPSTFTTSCVALAMPFIEDFNLGVVPPVCWSETITNTGYNWQASGTGNAKCPYDYVQDESLISPVIQITQLPASLQFKWMTSYYWLVNPFDNGDLICYIRINGGLWTPVWNEEMEGVFTSFAWYTEDIWLDNPFGPNVQLGDLVEVRFQYIGNDAADAHIEDVKIFQQPLYAQWNGSVSSDWFNTANWDTDIPGVNTDVTIPAVSTNYPTILNNPAYCDDIFFGSTSAGTATLLDNGLLTVGGIATIERYFSGNDPDWHLVSSPVSNAQAIVFMDMYLQSFDETPPVPYAPPSNGYTEITDELTPLNVMEGYALYSNIAAANTVTFAGNLNLGPQAHAFDLNANNPDGWNLLGNPYPSSIDWNLVTIPPEMNGEVHYIEASTGADISYLSGGGGGGRYVPPMQGFFVSALNPGTLQLTNAARTHTGAATFYKEDMDDLIVLKASGNNFNNDARIYFNVEATAEHDRLFDAYKIITSSNPALPQIYSLTPGGTKLSINGLPPVEMVPVGFVAGLPGEYIIAAYETSDFSCVILEDLLTGTQTDLLAGPYTFLYNTDEPENRFILHLTPLGVPDNFADGINIYSLHRNVYVSVPANTEGEIVVYNLMGQEVGRTMIKDVVNKVTLRMSNYYVVKVKSNESVVTKKVFVK